MGRDLYQISTRIKTKSVVLTGLQGLFKARQRAHIIELSLSKRQWCLGSVSAYLAHRRQRRRSSLEEEARATAGLALRPEARAGADLALRPEEDVEVWAPRATAGAEETCLALRAVGRGGEDETDLARRATERTGREMAPRAARCSALVRRRAITKGNLF